MKNSQSSKKKSSKLNLASATHNPIIAEHPDDSFNNIYAVLSVVRETVICHDVQGCCFEGESAHGMYLIMNCVMDALRFEMKQRVAGKS